MKFRTKYIYEVPHGNAYHTWVVIGARMALHLKITDMGEEHRVKYGGRYSGGIEFHWREPPEYMADEPPSNDHCWVLQAPCWHGGSSLQASGHWIPFWEAAPNDHGRMFRELELELQERTEQLAPPTTRELLRQAKAQIEEGKE